MGLFDLFKKKSKQPIDNSFTPIENIENNCNSQTSSLINNSVGKESQLEKRAKYIKSKEAEFTDILANLEMLPIQPSTFTKLSNGDYEVKFSNITAKSKRAQLQNFVVIDLETTGLRKTSGIVELSAIRFINFSPVAVFNTLVKPPRKIPEEATFVNGITNEMVAESPKIEDVANAFIDFVGDYNIVGHNLEFDLGLLEHKGIVFGKRKYFDTLELIKKVLKKPKYKYNSEYNEYEIDYSKDYDVDDYKLDTLCDYYSIFRPVSHRADSDCLATGYIFKKIVDEIL